MNFIKDFNEFQFINDFSFELRRKLSNDYLIEKNKQIGRKELDILITNTTTGNTYIVEVKGSPNRNNLPPEILPSLNSLKTLLDLPYNRFILLSISSVSERIKALFEKNGIEIFEYEKHKESLTDDFVSFLKEPEQR